MYKVFIYYMKEKKYKNGGKKHKKDLYKVLFVTRIDLDKTGTRCCITKIEINLFLTMKFFFFSAFFLCFSH